MIRKQRHKAIDTMWSAVYPLNEQSLSQYFNITGYAVDDFKQTLLGTISKGYDAKDGDHNSQWSYSGAFLYALTVSTTIGNIHN